MKITQIHIWRENLQLSRPYSIAFKTITCVENGIVEIETDKGLVGRGAFNPVAEVVGESLDDALAIYRQTDVATLLNRDIREINTLCADIRRLFPHNASVRAGLEIALFDLFSQFLEMPLATFLGQGIRTMPTSITIGIKNVTQTLEEAEEYVGRGFQILKVKTGQLPDEDLERIIKLREIYGRRIRIIVDANQGYDEAQLLHFWQESRPLDVEVIEQPFKPSMNPVVPHLPDSLKAQLVADESLIDAGDALALSTNKQSFGLFNIKLMKCGGITEALKISTIAQLSEIGLMWGCNDESLISITAALHCAFSCANTQFIDLDGSLDLVKDVVKGGFVLKDGMMSLIGKPGLGLEYL